MILIASERNLHKERATTGDQTQSCETRSVVVSRYSPGRSRLLREEKIKFGLSEPVGRAEARIKLFFSRRGNTADKTVPWPRLAKTFET